MRTIRLPFLRSKRGISTIIGTMIFIGIIFTTVVPMYLVMRQADTIYDQKTAFMSSFDQERADEKIIFYSFPRTNISQTLVSKVINTGAISVKIVRLWINDASFPTNITIMPTETKYLGFYNVTLPPAGNHSYYVKVTTSRGNIFPSSSGVLFYSDGTWYTASLGISVFIKNTQGKYQITVKDSAGNQIGYYLSGGTEFIDIVRWFDVPWPDFYTVTVLKYKGGQKWVNVPGSPIDVEILWPGGTPIVYVYVSGIGV